MISVETKGWRVLALSEIRTDAGCQPRSGIVDEVVLDYHAHLSHGGDLPPVTVFYDGSEYYLADGYHRFAAHDRGGFKRINAIIHQGALREAIFYSLGANKTHGLRPSNEDKRRAVERMLRDDEWVNWSDHRIAIHVGVSQSFASAVRRDLFPDSTKNKLSQPRVTKSGRTINTANIGRKSSAGAPLPREAVPADSQSPHDAPEDGDRDVTEQNPERAAVADPEPKRPDDPYDTDGPGSSSETNARPTDDGGTVGARSAGESADRPGSLHGEAGGSPAAPRDMRNMVAYWVDPDDPVDVFATGLTIAMRVNRVLDAEEFARCWPESMPMLPGELNKFCDWLLDFEAAFRAQYMGTTLR